MRSLSEIDTISKRAVRAKGFSWGASEEIGKSVKLLELFGLPGLKNLNQYLKIYDQNKFQKTKLISESNVSEKNYLCPISLGISFLDQINTLNKYNSIEFNKVAYPILFLSFASRGSEVLGKKILISCDEKEFILNFNQSIFGNYYKNEIWENANIVNIKFLKNYNSFNEIEWQEMTSFASETFVEESDELKEKSAGAGLTDND
jgi:hypothetical protein|tara:strand:- start:1481 stop:2092 length:612 start_codon:yes stop_codon:yes gene_type:complete